ncbi:hypothetical protein V8C37DRAFT_305583 [Trichoderma ceciliae]
MVAMLDFVSKISPRTMGSNIRRQVSVLATGTGSPRVRIRDSLTKITKAAKETRLRKLQLFKFSTMALFMVSQNTQNIMHRAIDQLLKPVARRGYGIMPFKTAVAQRRVPGAWEGQAEHQAYAQELGIRIIPKIIVTSPCGMVTDMNMLPPWNGLQRSSEIATRNRDWASSPLLSPLWKSRIHIWQSWMPKMTNVPQSTRRQHRNQVRDPRLKQTREPARNKTRDRMRNQARKPARNRFLK